MQLYIETGESLHQNKYIYKQIPPRLISSKPQFYLFQSHQHDKYIHYLIQKEDTKTDSKYSQFFFYVYSTPSILAIFMNKWCHYSIILKYKSNALLFNVFVQWIGTYLKFLKPIIYYIFSTVLKNDEHLKRNKRSQTDGNIFLRTRHRSNTITSVFLSEDTGNEFPNIEYF